MNSKIPEILGRLRTLVQAVPCDTCRFGDPATAEELAALAQLLPEGVPELLKELLACHNGIEISLASDDLDAWPDAWYRFLELNLLAVDEIIDSTRAFRELQAKEQGIEGLIYEQITGPAKPQDWNDRWLHIGGSGRRPICLDLDPPARGVMGQIIEIDYEDLSIQVLSRSLADYLEQILKHLKRATQERA